MPRPSHRGVLLTEGHHASSMIWPVPPLDTFAGYLAILEEVESCIVGEKSPLRSLTRTTPSRLRKNSI